MSKKSIGGTFTNSYINPLLMGNFEDHIKYGIYAFPLTLLTLISIAYFTTVPHTITVSLIPIALLATLIGAVFPDIDHHNSYPFQALKRYLPLAISGSFLAVYATQITTIHTTIPTYPNKSVTLTAFFGFIAAVFLLGLVRKGITAARPPHRGITHSKPFTAVTTVLISGVAYAAFTTTNIPSFAVHTGSITTALSFAIGMLAHFACDDILL